MITFGPVRARGGTPHTRAPSTGLLYPPRRCLYHLQRPSCRRRGRVPCRYSLSGTTVRRMIHVISHPGYRHDRRPPVRKKRQRNHCLAPGPPSLPPPPVPWRQMVQWHISALGQRRLVTANGLVRDATASRGSIVIDPEISLVLGR